MQEGVGAGVVILGLAFFIAGFALKEGYAAKRKESGTSSEGRQLVNPASVSASDDSDGENSAGGGGGSAGGDGDESLLSSTAAGRVIWPSAEDSSLLLYTDEGSPAVTAGNMLPMTFHTPATSSSGATPSFHTPATSRAAGATPSFHTPATSSAGAPPTFYTPAATLATPPRNGDSAPGTSAINQ